MNIYIAFDYNNNPLGVLLSDDASKARIAFHAMGETPHRMEEVDPTTAQGLEGVVFLLTSKACNSRRDYGHRINGVDFRDWKRGL